MIHCITVFGPCRKHFGPGFRNGNTSARSFIEAAHRALAEASKVDIGSFKEVPGRARPYFALFAANGQALRHSDTVGQCLQTVVALDPLPDQALPQAHYLDHLIACLRPSPDRRKLVPHQQLKYQLRIPSIVLVPRCGSLSYQNRIADK